MRQLSRAKKRHQEGERIRDCAEGMGEGSLAAEGLGSTFSNPREA